MSYHYDLIPEYEDKKLLARRSDNRGNEVVCYTKECFFGHDTWDEMTMKHRGVVYHNGRQVGFPFPKIFNMNEHESTNYETIKTRMNIENYTVMDKSNGHLFIVTCFHNDDGDLEIVYSTKGGLPNTENDLLNNDIKIWKEKFESGLMDMLNEYIICGNRYLFDDKNSSITLLFEALVEHDKHTLYDKQVEMYGENTFVLLSVRMHSPRFFTQEVVEQHRVGLQKTAKSIGVPLIKFYDQEVLHHDINQWFDHTDIEGYVIRFESDDSRFKIKTKEYWSIRMLKDLQPERLIELFAKLSPHEFRRHLPEEISIDAFDQIEMMFYDWFYFYHVREDLIPEYYADILSMEKVVLDGDERKALFTDPELTMEQKHFLASIVDDKEFQYIENKRVRQAFRDFMLSDESDHEDFDLTPLKEIVKSGLQ